MIIRVWIILSILAFSFSIADGFYLICRDFRDECFSLCTIQINWFDFALQMQLTKWDMGFCSSWHAHSSGQECRRRNLTLSDQEEAGESLKHMDKAKVPLHLTPEESWFRPSIAFITCFSMPLSCRSVLGWMVFLPWTSQVSRNSLFERHSQITTFPTKRAET